MTSSTQLWLQCHQPRPAARLRLICFPHAGGSAGFFRGWADRLPEFEIHAVRYPGRAERLAEQAPTDLGELAEEIAGAVEPLADRPLVLFGHSMGAVIALETARTLESRGVAVAHLFASGSRDGQLEDPLTQPDDVEDADALAERLVRLGGTAPELIHDPDFRELVLPYVRSDGRMYQSHARSFRLSPRLACDVTTVVGEADADADRRPWSELTDGTHRERVIAGGDHFYLVQDPPVELIRESVVRESGRRGRTAVEQSADELTGGAER